MFQSVIPGKYHLTGVSDSQLKLSTLAKITKTVIRKSQCIEGNFKFITLLQFSLNTKQNDYIRLLTKCGMLLNEVTYHGPN